jgi:hypothetical protein
MATWFSDHYSSGSSVNALPATPVRPSAGVGHARKRYKRAKITVPATVAVDDVLRLMTFRSGDRITDIRVHADDVFTATTDLDIGIHKAGVGGLHDGAAIDDNLFADALDLGGGLEDVEAFIEGGVLVGENRGEPLWYLANIGGGTYTADPKEEWDLTGTVLVDATTGGTIVVEVEYTSGD